MPRVVYTPEEKEEIRSKLLSCSLELMARQGVRRTTVEQIYRAVGISRSFFYSFFSSREDLILQALYLQQPRVIAHLESTLADPALSWGQAVRQFLLNCCYGERSGIAVLTIEEQQLLFKRLSPESYQLFREKQRRLFGQILERFGIRATGERIALFTNLSLTAMVIRRAIPDTLPLFVPEAADETVRFQINAIVDVLEQLREQSSG